MRDLIEAAKAVLFDFDGPICHLFRKRPPAAIAQRLEEVALAHHSGAADWLPRGTRDPQEILRAVFEQPGLVESGVARDIERALTEEEVQAAPGAFPTAYADALIRTLVATGRELAVTTNNSQQAVERYLETRTTHELFAGRVHGRSAEGALRLKPDPDCLLRALESTKTPAQEALMIGDAPRDLEAARAAGVAFLGYARNERKEQELRAAGAGHVVGSLRDVLLTVDPRAHV
ncbi:HAD family hydrolase [Streptomyces sp. WMMB 322]|uniref:HAD family hydrolase n=1 Tax=Streptomyces sp. WMMB 322 TaxID=1286821 RepID=UPI0006E2C0DA|nr:HAD-IA family hydrolase [Streptomyces sp. WMMB 322]SCK05282.1 haloacid dehalogenase superfamily, subfamily IA, variant 3 with third motif having DD or ED/haloacid dehalogenase superfamily, subfamily IA, variant 1 with third motif having Dx(3-4)D or Dx(3-4)E [Streptomyces sp. WMMB 322]